MDMRVKKEKGKIKYWRKMREKLIAKFYQLNTHKTVASDSTTLDKNLKVLRSTLVSLRSS